MIKLVVFDIDGVLTDGSYLINNEGIEYKKISFKDLDSFTLIKKLEYKTLFLTGEQNSISKYFNDKFKPDYFIDGANDKYDLLLEFCHNHKYNLDEVCYVGDGKKDLDCMKNVGISISPENAIEEIKNIATNILSVKGGDGVVYEVYKILKNINNPSNQEFLNILNSHQEIINLIKNDEDLLKNIDIAVEIMIKTLKKNNIIYSCGNGGSAADAQHFVAELISKFNYDRKSLGAISLTTNPSIITSIGNDYVFDNIFCRQIEGLSKEGDALFAITTSGTSKNITLAIEEAKRKNVSVILLTSTKCNLQNDNNFVVIKVPCEKTPRIQEFHIMVIHYICEKIERYFMEENNEK